MTRFEAQERLRRIREKIQTDHDDINRLVEFGHPVEAAARLKASAGSVDYDEVLALAIIAEGKESLV